MTDAEHRLVRFPPLTIAPSWATAPAPTGKELHAIEALVEAELPHLALIQRTFNIRPAPDRMQLHRIARCRTLYEVVVALRTMRYPAEWTHWIDTARTLARRATEDLDCCYESIEWLKWSAPGTSEHRQQLGAAQRSIQRAYQHASTLHGHFAHLPTPASQELEYGGRVIHLAERYSGG